MRLFDGGDRKRDVHTNVAHAAGNNAAAEDQDASKIIAVDDGVGGESEITAESIVIRSLLTGAAYRMTRG